MAAICYHWCEWKQKPSVLVCPLMSLTTKPQHLHGQLTLHKQLSVSKADLGSPRSKAEVYLLIALQGVDMHIMASSTHLLASFPNTLSLCFAFHAGFSLALNVYSLFYVHEFSCTDRPQ